MRRRRLSISGQFMLLFFLLLFPLMVLGALIINSNANQLRGGVMEMTQMSLDSLQESLESNVLSMQNRLLNLLSSKSPDIRAFYANYANLSDSEYYLSIRRIRETLQEALLYDNLFSGLEVYYPSLGLSIHSRIGVRQRDIAKYSPLLEASFSQNWGLKSADGALFISSALPSIPTTCDDIQILLVARVSDAALRKLLSSGIYEDQPSLLAYEETGYYVSTDPGFTPQRQQDDQYLRFTARSDVLNCTLVTFLPAQRLFRVSNRLTRMLLLFLLACIPIFALYSLFTHCTLQKPVRNLLDAMNTMRQGKLDFHIDDQSVTYEFALLTQGLNEMLVRLNELIRINYQQEIDARRLELKHLQAQINPHFLYNALYTLRHMIECEDNDNAGTLAAYLGDYFRYLTATDRLDISLREEYAHALNYMNIQCLRFSSRIRTEAAELPAAWKDLTVPRLIIQPLYENALSYAIHRDSLVLTVKTSFRETDGRGIICVEDSGSSLDDEALRNLMARIQKPDSSEKVTALVNICRRLQLRYGERYGMTLGRSQMGGLKVELTIPLGKD